MCELSWRERGRLWLRLGLRLVLTLIFLLAVVRLGPTFFALLLLSCWRACAPGCSPPPSAGSINEPGCPDGSVP